MRRLRDADPAQPTVEYWRRTVLYGVFKALTQPRLFGAFAKVADTLGIDREQWLHKWPHLTHGKLFNNKANQVRRATRACR